MALGRSLTQAVETPAAFGCSSPEEALATVAKHRSVYPAALKDIIAAARFLSTHRPDILADEDVRVRMTQVLLLKQFMAVNPELARQYEAPVFDGSIRYRDLLAILQDARRASREQRQGTAADTGYERRQIRGRAFERAVSEYLEANIGDLLGELEAAIQSAKRLRPTPTDLVAVVNGEIVAAIEIKAFRLAIYPRQIFETASLLAVLQRASGQAWLVVTPEWEDNVPALVDTMRTLKVDGVHVAVFDSGESKGTEAFRLVDAV